jgi:urease accessory protein
MAWHAQLDIAYAMENGRTAVRHRHEGPLRVLQTLYPEGTGIAHNVLVHPPSGIVGGDTLDVTVRVGPGAHALVTTPGAARFYRSEGETAVQRARLDVESGGRLEWLPLEALAYSGCIAENHLVAKLAQGAEMIGWDVTALGLPGADLPFSRGTFLQHVELAGHWLERGRVDANDARLMDGPLGLDGMRGMGTLFFASGDALADERRERLLDLAQKTIAACGGELRAGATAPGPHVVAVRVLAPMIEPAMTLLKAVHAAWRPAAWGLAATQSRIWAL